MRKELTSRDIATLKRIARNVDSDVQKRDKLTQKINELTAERDALNAIIDMHEAPVKYMTDGFTTQDLIKKVVTVLDKVDKDGRTLKSTDFVLRYPETVYPPEDTAEPETPAVENAEPTTEEAEPTQTPTEF